MLSIPISAKALVGLGLLACTACVGTAHKPDAPKVAAVFYTVTGEIALSRHQPRLAALQYAAAARATAEPALLRRATEVTSLCLQPALTEAVAVRWLEVDPNSLDAQRALAEAALELDHIERSAVYFRAVVQGSSLGSTAELTALQPYFEAADNIYGARRVADRLAQYFPDVPPALRLQAFAALRGDDPLAAARTLRALLGPGTTGASQGAVSDERRELLFAQWRARILSGDRDGALADAKSFISRRRTPDNRLAYALLLLAGRENTSARDELGQLTADAIAKPAALRLLALLDFRDGDLAMAATRFAELVGTGKYLGDAFYFSGLIAERRDIERALRLYAEVPQGDYFGPALQRAAAILRAQGAVTAADDIFKRLVEEQPQRAPEILAAQARLSANAGDLPRAYAVLDDARAEYPDSVELRYAQASLWEEHGRLPAALDELQRVITLRPGDPAALNAYGYTLADHGERLAAAREYIEQAYAAAPQNAAILDSLGWVLFRQGHGREGLPYLNAAYEDDRGGEVAAHLGEVLWTLGQRGEAEQIWAQARLSEGEGNSPLLSATIQRLTGTR